MKSWKTAFVLLTMAVLPLALVAVGDAQQLTCWYLKPADTEAPKLTSCPSATSESKQQEDIKTKVTRPSEETDSISCVISTEEATSTEAAN